MRIEIAESYAEKAQTSLVETGFPRSRGKTKRWVENFLSDRTQQAAIEGEHSYTASVASEVPLGSVLGQSLFLIYVSDLSDGMKSRVRLYADDTTF